ncbi:MAG: AAA family ATPase [Deltaproteobacteria bacterium]|nr:AAA family ATPase [Deltaproteobacteria bacterium]
MKLGHAILFRPFRLDTENEILWRGTRVIALRQKSFALLRYLAEHPGQLVSKEELLGAVWPETRVSDIVLKVCIREVRQVLGDHPQTPLFIETVQRRGYRFIRPVRSQDLVQAPKSRIVRTAEHNSVRPESITTSFSSLAPLPLLPLPKPRSHQTAEIVGRQQTLMQLQDRLADTLAGEQQLLFITGESGIGKTALIDTFLAQIAEDPRLWIARGQCVAHYGEGEAYLPVFEALHRLCHEPGHERFLSLLNRYAPLWLAQMPSLLTPQDRDRLQREVRGATKERMLREIIDAIEALTAEVALVLVLEDLHWSDHATLELLLLLGRRHAARLFIVATYRPTDIGARAHPLKSVKHELQTHGHCQHLPLTLLTVADVARYLAARCTPHAFPPALAHALHRHTEGNPLFVTAAVDRLMARGAIACTNSHWRLTTELDTIEFAESATLQELIEGQIDRLTPEEEAVLKVASVAGVTFSTAGAAAGLEAHVETVEGWCDALAQRTLFLRADGHDEWSDGTVATRYAFIHALYQQGWYERVPAAKRVQLHRRIAVRLERGYGSRADEIAAELALHYEQGRDFQRALHYRRVAAENAIQRFGYREAIAHLTKGVALLAHVSDTQERTRQEVVLHNALGAAYMATQGYASPAVAQAYESARALSQPSDDAAQLAPALRGLWAFSLTRAELRTARLLADQLLHVAQQEHSQALLLEAERELGQTLYFLGELPAARQALEHSLAKYDPEAHADHIFLYGQDPKVVCLAHLARTLCLLGYPDQALRQIETALAFAREVAHPYTLALASYHAAVVFQACGDWPRTLEAAQSAMTLSTEQGFPYWRSSSQILYGWALARQGHSEEGIRHMQQGISDYAETGATLNRPYALALLAEAYGATGRADEGLVLLNEALTLVQGSGGHFYQAEMLRLRGELLLRQAAI